MALITVSEKDYNQNNLTYVRAVNSEIFSRAKCITNSEVLGSRAILKIDCPDCYEQIIKAEVADKLAEIIAVNYKYDYFTKMVKVSGLNLVEREILMASLIAADFEEDKRYAYEKLKGLNDVAIDGMFNFRMQPLKRKWIDVVSYMPSGFLNSQLKEFVSYLLENKRQRTYIEGEKVYDCHYRRLNRTDLLGGESVNIVREVLLSNCGEVEITGKIPEEDESYLREFYKDKIYFS